MPDPISTLDDAPRMDWHQHGPLFGLLSGALWFGIAFISSPYLSSYLFQGGSFFFSFLFFFSSLVRDIGAGKCNQKEIKQGMQDDDD